MKRINTAVWMEQYQHWQIKVQKDGKRRTFYSPIPGRNGQRECNNKADDWLDGELVSPNTRVSALFTQWIAELKTTTCKDHWRQYESYGKNWIGPVIGHMKMGNLTEQHLQSVILAAHKKGLSKKTLGNLRGCMTAFVKYGRKCKATTLFVENLYVPKNAPVGERTILQPDDLKKLFSVDETVMRGTPVYELYINAFRFEVATGLRPGEVIGLKWSDINRKRGTVSIRRSINRDGIETGGKNDNAKRTFALIPLALDILTQQKEKMLELGIISDVVFPGEDCKYIRQATYYKRWIRYRDNAGITAASPYELRHTFVSIVKQLPEGLLKPLVGHSKDMDTYGTYSHEIDGDMKKTADLVQSLFSSVIQKLG